MVSLEWLGFPRLVAGSAPLLKDDEHGVGGCVAACKGGDIGGQQLLDA